MNVRELLDQHLPLGRDRLPLAVIAGVWAVLLGLPLVCCCGCPFLFSDKPAEESPRRPTTALAPINSELAAEIDREIEGARVTASPPSAQHVRPPERDAPAADAARLLKAAAHSEKGEILLWERAEGLTLQVKAEKFCEPADGPREAARWRAALDSLHSLGLIEVARVSQSTGLRYATFEYWRVTAAGYGVADSAPAR